ncbi:uncharacterized protein TNCT_326111 [Trichonephila clavata]|uniref:NADH dehydrogenase [ubiquinone] 1 alpha subcomplex subunit 1 n=1 Tax=Trichonephila clavata TaxID=2740835 RepID=A0A8X6INM1_TRICU|nr:uncharacterized protein TNCT_326111 [Trichonephila clavata]
MWYEILPTLGVFGTFLVLPCFTPYFVGLAVRGKPHPRTSMEPEDMKLTMRDERLTGHYYKMKGLESIPDPQ